MEGIPTPVVEPIEDMLKKLNTNAVFGEPVREGETIVIPVASVTYGFGYGSGYGQAPAAAGAAEGTEAEKGTEVARGSGGGSGGGGGGAAKPLGFIRIKGDDVRYEPLMNPSAISLAGIGMVAWSIFWITKTVRAFLRTPCCCG